MIVYHFEWEQLRRLHINRFPTTGKRIHFFSPTHPSIIALFHRNQFWKPSVSCWSVAKAGLFSAPQPPPSHLTCLLMLHKEKKRDSYTTAVLADMNTFQIYTNIMSNNFWTSFLNYFVQLRNNRDQKERPNNWQCNRVVIKGMVFWLLNLNMTQ